MRAIANKNLLIRAAFLVLTICATVVWLNYWTATWSQTYLPLIGRMRLAHDCLGRKTPSRDSHSRPVWYRNRSVVVFGALGAFLIV